MRWTRLIAKDPRWRRPNIAALAFVLIWIAEGLIVLVFLTRYDQPKAEEPRSATVARLLLILGLAVLVIDSLFFSAWFTSRDEAAKNYLSTNFYQSEYTIIPKVGLLIAAIAGLILTWRNRVQEIEKETENLKKISALNAVAATVSQSLNLEEILDSTLEKVGSICGNGTDRNLYFYRSA